MAKTAKVTAKVMAKVTAKVKAKVVEGAEMEKEAAVVCEL